jgi:hypothetical protein
MRVSAATLDRPPLAAGGGSWDKDAAAFAKEAMQQIVVKILNQLSGCNRCYATRPDWKKVGASCYQVDVFVLRYIEFSG